MKSASELIKQTAFQMGREIIHGYEYEKKIKKKPRSDEERGSKKLSQKAD